MTTTVPKTREASALATSVAGLSFANPIVLAAGTAGYGRELASITDLRALGGIVTKAVSVTPRAGAPAPRVAEFAGGMINAVGLANPGLDAVRGDHLPWLLEHLAGAPTRVIVNVVGGAVEEFATVVAGLDDVVAGGRTVDAFELNVSCPNVRAGGTEFGASPNALREVVAAARRATSKLLFVKLSPALPDIGATARVAAGAGADAITLVNTLPGLVIDVDRRRPALGFGSGGVSGSALLPIGVLATWKVHQALPGVGLLGIGGVTSASDALQYVLAGASLVGMGTAAMRDPRLPLRIVGELEKWCARERTTLASVVGQLEWPS